MTGRLLQRVGSSTKGVLMIATVLWSGQIRAGANQWTGNGPVGRAWIDSVAYIPTTPPAILAGGFPTFIARSTDNGTTWTAVTDIPTDADPWNRFFSFAVTPSNPLIVFAAWEGSTSADLSKSTDGGTTWVSAGHPDFNVNGVEHVVVAPSNGSVVYAGTGGGVYTSTDGGASWAAPTIVMARTFSLAIDPGDASIVYLSQNAGAPNRLLRSVDSGATWTPASSGLPSEAASGLAIDPSNHATIYAATSQGVYRTTNSGGGWTSVSGGLPAGRALNVFYPPDAPGTLVALYPYSTWKTTNGGTTWTQFGPASNPFDQICAAGPLSNLFVGTHAGLFRSTNGGAALTPLPSLTAGKFAPVWVARGDPASATTLYAGTYAGLYGSTDDGQSWSDQTANLPSGHISDLFIFPGAPNVRVVSTSLGAFRSTDAGASYLPSGFSGFMLTGDPFQPNVTYAGGTGGVQVSTDYGATWTLYTNGLPPGVQLFVVAPDPLLPGTLYTGSYHSTAGLFKSTDGGHNWTNLPSFPTTPYVQTIAVDPFNSLNLYAGAGYFRKSTDGGNSWSTVAIPPSGGWVNTITADPIHPNTFWMATDNGLYVTPDGGGTWSPMNTGLPVGSSAQYFDLHPGDHQKYIIGNMVTGGGWSYDSNPSGNIVSGGGAFGSSSSVSSGWTSTGSGAATYSALNAPGSTGGSALVTVGTSGRRTTLATPPPSGTGNGIMQACAPVDARFTYSMAGKLFVASGQSATGSGAVVTSWFSDVNCTQYLSATQTPSVGGTTLDTWLDSALTGIRPPAGALRGRLGLSVTRTGGTGTFGVNFDALSFAITCDSPTALVSGGQAISGTSNAQIQVALTGLAPWVVTWSDGFVQTTSVSPAFRTVPVAPATRYSATAVTDGYSNCPGTVAGDAPVGLDPSAQVPTLGPFGLLTLTVLLAAAGLLALAKGNRA